MSISIRSIRSLWLLALLAASPALLAAQAGYYRWKDDKGQFQATQQPPADRPSEFVRTSTGTSSQVAPGETSESAGSTSMPPSGQTAGKPATEKKPVGMQAVPDKDPAKCKQAQDTQMVLNSHARIREKGDNGEYRYLAPEEIAEQKKLAEESVGVFCEPSAAP